MAGRLLLGLVLGAIGGVVAFLVQEPLLDHQEALINPAAATRQTVWLSVILGACFGFALGTVDNLTRGLPTQAARKGLIAAFIGVPGAMIALFLGDLVYGTLSQLLGNPVGMGAQPTPLGFVTDLIPRTLGWMFFGTGMGAAVGTVTGSAKRWWHSTIGGAIGGMLGGIAFQIFTLVFAPAYLAMSGGERVEIGAPGRAVGFPVLGASIGFFIALVQEALKPAWIRVILGRNEGREYPVDKPVCVIGRDEYADIPLFGDMQIAPQHARIVRQQNRHLLQDLGAPAGTLLNGQPVQQAWLKDGDIIQIASMRLQFFEKATRSIVREALERQEKPAARPPMPDYICPYCGERKDPVTGQCACSVLPGTVAPPVSQTGVPQASVAAPIPSRLVVRHGAKAGTVFPLTGVVVTVGRDVGRDVLLDFDATVSRRHARLERQGNQWVLIDEGSRNGSFVNGQRVQQSAIHPGDVLRFGATELHVE